MQGASVSLLSAPGAGAEVSLLPAGDKNHTAGRAWEQVGRRETPSPTHAMLRHLLCADCCRGVGRLRDCKGQDHCPCAPQNPRAEGCLPPHFSSPQHPPLEQVTFKYTDRDAQEENKKADPPVGQRDPCSLGCLGLRHWLFPASGLELKHRFSQVSGLLSGVCQPPELQEPAVSDKSLSFTPPPLSAPFLWRTPTTATPLLLLSNQQQTSSPIRRHRGTPSGLWPPTRQGRARLLALSPQHREREPPQSNDHP